MIDRTLPLNALRAFEATARHGSLTAAARELQVSVSAVSRHVALLEAHLDHKLLKRLRSGVELTERGKSYFSKIGAAFDLINIAGKQGGLEAPKGRLDISLYTTFGLEWFAQRLERFQALFPDIVLKLAISTEEADFDCDRVDIALTGALSFDRRFHYDRVFESRLVPVCLPKLLKGKKSFDTAEQLLAETLLYERREVVFWFRWFESMGIHTSSLERGLRFDSATLAYQAARAGMGVALAQLFYVEDELRRGELIAPVPSAIAVPFTHRLLCRKSRMDEPSIKAFREWLLSEARITNDAVDGVNIAILDSSGTQGPIL